MDPLLVLVSPRLQHLFFCVNLLYLFHLLHFTYLENENFNLQTKFSLHITSSISKITKLYNHGITHTSPNPPTLKAYPTPGVSGSFNFFFLLKWRKSMNLNIPGANFPFCCAFLSTRAKTVWVGCCNPPPP